MSRWMVRIVGVGLLLGLSSALVGKTGGDPSAELGGTERALTYVSTDKPLYREGETVYVRAVALRASDRVPVAGGSMPMIEIKGPKGETVATLWAQLQDGVAGLSWGVPQGQAGGRYTIRVSWPNDGYAPAERKFDVRAYRAPRLKTQIVFLRDGYGPNDTVRATLHVERPEGGAPAGAKVDVVARVDGATVHQGTATVDKEGNAGASFALPATMERGEGTLAMTVQDGGVVETATKTIPILLQTLDLALYPEGGDLVAGLPARVYVEARTPWGKPADIQAEVVDSMGRQVATLATEHEGRGRFELVPSPGETYTLKVVEPKGIERTWPLPQAKEHGATLASDARVVAKGAPVKLNVGSTDAGTVTVTLSRREVEVARKTLRLGAGEVKPLALSLPPEDDGVLVATVWGEGGHPLAERLIFRNQSKSLKLSIGTDHRSYAPGGEVELTVTAKDSAGKPTEAIVGLTVTDDSVLEMVDKREQAPRLPVMVLLETDVRELADAHVYLDPDDARAPAAVDLLLGTQGWRRFAFVDPMKFVATHGDAARRVLALRTPPPPPKVFFRGGGGGRRHGMAMEGAMPMDEPMAAAIPDEEPVEMLEAPVPDAQPAPEMNAEIVDMPVEAGVVAPERMKEIAEMEDMDDEMAGEKMDLLEQQAILAAPMVVVREYAHQVRPDRQPGERSDFTETVYWAAGVRTDPKTGQATVRFGLSDAITGFRVQADAFGSDGALGSGSALVESVEPFSAEPKMPLFVTQGDVVQLPIALTNGTDALLDGATLSVTAPKGVGASTVANASLGPKSGVRRLVTLEIGKLTGAHPFVVDATAGPYHDRVTRTLTVEPSGFPMEVGFGGLVEPGGKVTRTVNVSKGVVPGSLTAHVEVQPTPLASLTSAFERLIQEPYGCFEQTSSTTYPLVMAQQYFTSHEGVDPKLIGRSTELLAKGYDRLTGFECKKHGYEWFGEDPGHETLTAYGLLEFTDMSGVRPVDQDMLRRTREWLLKRRDGKGGFTRERRALHTWIEDRDASNAYIVYALVTTGGPDGLENEIRSIEDAALGSKNSYVHALTASALQLGGRADGAKPLLDRLAKAQAKDGGVDGATASIVGSTGDALRIETTALATLAWLRDPAYAENVEGAVRWLADACKAGRYGSTQSTVLALQAVVAYDKARAVPGAPGTVRLLVDGREIGTVPFDIDQKGAIALPDFAEALGPGRHEVTVALDGGKPMPVTGAIRWSDVSPASSSACPLALTAKLTDATIAEGGVTEIEVTVSNKGDAAVPTPIAIIGVPGGLEPRADQLEELKKAGTIAAWEVRGRDVVLYWRDLGAKKSVRLPVSLLAAIPGTYTGPASRAYLYYGDEHKSWVEGAKVTVTPKG